MIRKTILKAILVIGIILTSPVHAAIVTTWTQDQGTAPTSGLNTSAPVFGDGTVNNSADNIAVSGSLLGSFTAANVGDAIQMTGSMTLVSISNNIDGQFGFGIFNTNGSGNATGWLGYLATNSDGVNAGPLLERNAGNSTIYSSTTGATQISSATATGSPNFTEGTYSFSLTLTRQAGDVLDITYSLTGTGYSLSGSFSDASVNTFTFDRVGFVVGPLLNANQFSLTNVNFSLVPEPGQAALLAPCLLGLLARRSRRRN